MAAKHTIEELLKEADITINGTRPWDVQIHDERVFDRILADGSLGAGESYMDGWWSAPALDETLCRVHRAKFATHLNSNTRALFSFGFYALLARIHNRQNKQRATQVAKQHYDIGNELYGKMLDPWLQYSCGYFEQGATTLTEAQEAKLALIAKKLKLQPGLRVLDIGCGWGGLAKFLATHYDVTVTGITLSREQAAYARDWTAQDTVEIQIADYRTLDTKPFDRIVSVGMFEHVGYKNYQTYMHHCARLLKDDGIFLLHTIGRDISGYATDPWIDKYIFPNGMLPSPRQITTSFEGIFSLEDWHNFGPSYDRTLLAWYHNFTEAWPELQAHKGYDEHFYRMWEFYLLASAGLFRSRTGHLWQLILTKHGLAGGYRSVR